MTVPCQLNPDAYLQPGEDDLWHHRAETRFAQLQCRNNCERFRECAADALAAGTCEGQQRDRVADGCVMAGVVCRGDAATYLALHQIVNPDVTPDPYRVDGSCSDCQRTFIPDSEPIRLGANTAHRLTAAYPLCRACYQRQRRAGSLAPARTVVPSHCQGPCGRPLHSRESTLRLVGSVRHESGGLCAACVRATRRAEGEVA